MRLRKKTALMLFILSLQIFPQNSNLIYIDQHGKIKWTDNNKDAYFFGVNYSLPFAFSYRALKNKNIPHKEIIDMDVQQFKRLDLNAYRIHVWDREISDRNGNFINNEHVDLLDYLISRLIENKIYIVLTPIAWWGTGWPEPDIPTEGFSSFYSKIESTTKPEIIRAHVNYLRQFVNHVNPYTGKSYKDEPFIIAFEIFNEPNLPKNSDSVKYYVNTTASAISREGVTKPIFFNISENPGKEQWEGVASSDIQGISFQWYPTGLVKYSELNGNFILNVFSYPLPDWTDKINNKAKMVYEFDAADIGKSYMYPLMAHSFKETGMQFAAMFCYDPSAIAQYNSEYQTHFLNLLYTPQKALSFLIASHLFNYEEISRKKTDSTSVIMNNIFVDYMEDLSLMNTVDRFYYSNSNNVIPKDLKKLRHIAGYGNSEIIKYNGRGAYFLDKIEDDIWRLELFPDAVWIKDPFGRNGLDEPAAKMIWKEHEFKLVLPGLNPDFKVYYSEDKNYTASKFSLNLKPGVYFITNKDLKEIKIPASDFDKIRKFGDFIEDFGSSEIKNLTASPFYEDERNKISFEIYSKGDPEVSVYLRKSGWGNFRKFEMNKVSDFLYEFPVPDEFSSNGILEYYISLNEDKKIVTFPGRMNISPDYWSFNPREKFSVPVLPSTARKTIYDPAKDKNNFISANIWRFAEYRIDYTFDEEAKEELNISIGKIKQEFPEFALQFYTGEYLKNIIPDKEDKLEFEMRKNSGGPDLINIRIIFDNTLGFERRIQLNNDYEKIVVPLSGPEKMKYALLPRPYPTFLPYWYESIPEKNSEDKNFKLESIQISIPLPEAEKNISDYGIKLKKINYITEK